MLKGLENLLAMHLISIINKLHIMKLYFCHCLVSYYILVMTNDKVLKVDMFDYLHALRKTAK